MIFWKSPRTDAKEVIRSVAQEEDRRNNVIIFGVQEREKDNLRNCVKEVFDEMRVRPDIRKICSVVKKSSESSSRPINVRVSSASTASLILGQARLLRNSEVQRLRSVFVKPDRTKEEREERRSLVQDMKQRRTSEPNKRHYIRGGAVHSEDINIKSKK